MTAKTRTAATKAPSNVIEGSHHMFEIVDTPAVEVRPGAGRKPIENEYLDGVAHAKRLMTELPGKSLRTTVALKDYPNVYGQLVRAAKVHEVSLRVQATHASGAKVTPSAKAHAAAGLDPASQVSIVMTAMPRITRERKAKTA